MADKLKEAMGAKLYATIDTTLMHKQGHGYDEVPVAGEVVFVLADHHATLKAEVERLTDRERALTKTLHEREKEHEALAQRCERFIEREDPDFVGYMPDWFDAALNGGE